MTFRKDTGRKKRVLVYALVCALVAGSIAILFLFNPEKYAFYPPCFFHELTGLYCPGCGTGRALYAIVHGDILRAFNLNPLAMILFPYLFYSFISWSMDTLFDRPLPYPKLPSWSLWVLVGVIMIYWVARNIPAYPFDVLAP